MVNQAKCMAHYLHAKMREGYYTDLASGKSKGGDKPHRSSLNDLMGAMKAGKSIPGMEVLPKAAL